MATAVTGIVGYEDDRAYSNRAKPCHLQTRVYDKHKGSEVELSPGWFWKPPQKNDGRFAHALYSSCPIKGKRRKQRADRRKAPPVSNAKLPVLFVCSPPFVRVRGSLPNRRWADPSYPLHCSPPALVAVITETRVHALSKLALRRPLKSGHQRTRVPIIPVATADRFPSATGAPHCLIAFAQNGN